MPQTHQSNHIQLLPFRAFQVPLSVCRLPGEHPLALVLPALGVPAAKYQQLLSSLQQRGYHTAICEMPGTGESHPRPHRQADYGYSDLVFDWIPQLLRQLEQDFPGGPALILGHSIGGQISTLAAKAQLTGNARVVSVASGHLDSRSWRGGKRLLILSAAATAWASANLLGYFPGQQLKFGDREARSLMSDWGRSIISGRFAAEKRIPARQQSIHPSLHLSITGDPFAPLPATRKLAGLINGEVREIAPSYPKGNPHLSWIKHPGPVVEQIHSWLERASSKSAAA